MDTQRKTVIITGALGGIGYAAVLRFANAGYAVCGMDILGFSLATNMAAGILDQPLTEEEVLETGEACKTQFSALMLNILKKL